MTIQINKLINKLNKRQDFLAKKSNYLNDMMLSKEICNSKFENCKIMNYNCLVCDCELLCMCTDHNHNYYIFNNTNMFYKNVKKYKIKYNEYCATIDIEFYYSFYNENKKYTIISETHDIMYIYPQAQYLNITQLNILFNKLKQNKNIDVNLAMKKISNLFFKTCNENKYIVELHPEDNDYESYKMYYNKYFAKYLNII